MQSTPAARHTLPIPSPSPPALSALLALLYLTYTIHLLSPSSPPCPLVPSGPPATLLPLRSPRHCLDVALFHLGLTSCSASTSTTPYAILSAPPLHSLSALSSQPILLPPRDRPT